MASQEFDRTPVKAYRSSRAIRKSLSSEDASAQVRVIVTAKREAKVLRMHPPR